MTAIATNHHALLAWRRVMAQIAERMATHGAHPARTVVLLPYAQLMPLAARLWAQAHPDGFAPRFETTRNWARQLSPFAPSAHDLSFDVARDTLTARMLLDRAGLAAQRDLLASRLVEAAGQLASLAAAVPPAQREDWASQARLAVSAGAEGGVLMLEAAVARIAVAWAAASCYATDVLTEERVAASLDGLIVLEGFQAEPLAQALQARLGDKVIALPLPAAAARGALSLHAASDAEDEAQRAAACVLRHIEAGRVPVALAATDRALTRRIRAMLDGSQVAVRDENGWKLSTTRAAARVMAALRACSWNTSSDAVLDWLKNAPAFASGPVRALEQWLRKTGLRDWRAEAALSAGAPPALVSLLAQVGALRQGLQRGRSLPQWLAGLRELLQACGLWELLAQDAAGARLLAVLRLEEGAQAELETLEAASRRMPLVEFSAWVNEVLEAASFVPPHPPAEQVVILPLSQLLARPMAALVLPGGDELRLSVSPEPPGPWTAAQRAALGLPTREALEAAQRAAWAYALQTPHCDLLWRAGDEGGEPLLPSPLVQALQLDGGLAEAGDPRPLRQVAATPQARPEPRGQALPVTRLSASAYGDLRSCPYRFFALRQLGLKESDEIEAEVDKRDFGLWLHAVLRGFHETLQAQPTADRAARAALLDQAAEAATRAQALDAGEFLPFTAVWPRLREGYLDWLADFEAQGAAFEAAEVWKEQPLGHLTLVGQIDRIDRLADGTAMLIDYKTESQAATARRLKEYGEDTQISFYAALLADDRLRAAYVNVGEKEPSKTYEQSQVVEMRDLLIEAIHHDLARIDAGAALPALGEGAVCEFCAARGLCRKDFWS